MKNIREEINFKNGGSLLDAFDDYIKGMYNITDDEYDYIAKHITDDELSDFFDAIGMGGKSSKVTYPVKRKGIEIRNKYLLEIKNNS